MSKFERGPTVEYNKEAWEELKKSEGGAYGIFNAGRKMGVPQEELVSFAEMRIAERATQGDFEFEYNLRKSLNLASEEELVLLKKKADDALEAQNNSVREIKKERDEDEKTITIKISPNATFADLFAAIEKLDDIDDAQIFYLELDDNFDQRIVEAVHAFQDQPQAASIKVVEFFKQQGYSKKEIETFLPIKFTSSKPSKKKK